MKTNRLIILTTFIILSMIYVYQAQNIENIICLDKRILITNYYTTYEEQYNDIYVQERILNDPGTKLKLKAFLGLSTTLGIAAYAGILTYTKIKGLTLLYGIWNPDPIFLLATGVIITVAVVASMPVSIYTWTWLDIESLIYLDEKWSLEQKTADDLLAAEKHRRFLKDFFNFIYEFDYDENEDLIKQNKTK